MTGIRSRSHRTRRCTTGLLLPRQSRDVGRRSKTLRSGSWVVGVVGGTAAWTLDGSLRLVSILVRASSILEVFVRSTRNRGRYSEVFAVALVGRSLGTRGMSVSNFKGFHLQLGTHGVPSLPVSHGELPVVSNAP